MIKEKGWDKALSCETSKPYFRRLQTFLDAQYSSKVIFPPREQIFNAFESCPLHNVKVRTLVHRKHFGNPDESILPHVQQIT